MRLPRRTVVLLAVLLWTPQGQSIYAQPQGSGHEGPEGPERAEREFVFEKLNRTFESFVEDLSPIELGSMRVGLSSPEHSMTLESHSARLLALGNGEYRTRLEFRFHGDGILSVQIEIGGVESELEDTLVLPSQGVVLEGRLKIEPVEDGYEIILLEAFQQDVAVRIESKIAGRIVPLCWQLSLVLLNLNCDVLQETLSVVRVPMPEPGKTFLLLREELTESEIEEFDAFLASSGNAG